jgi:5'(3')-deoxyribonucleotidase
MKRLKLLIDMDSTCNEFIPHFIQAVRDRGYSFDFHRYNTNGSWDIENFILGADDQKTVMNSIMSDLEMWETIPIADNADTVLKDLNRFHDITIATTPWGSDEVMKQVKRDWVATHLPFLSPRQVVFTSKKWTLEGDVIFDDKPDTIQQCNATMITVVPTQPYNRNVESDFRFANWSQVPKIIGTITKFYDRFGR